MTIPNLISKEVIKKTGTVQFVKAKRRIVENIEILWPQDGNSGLADRIVARIEERISQELIAQIEKILKRYAELLIQISSEDRGDVRELATQIANDINELHEAYITPHIQDEYKIIKVAHHGTKRYYTAQLPEAEQLIIPNVKWRGWDMTVQ